MQPSREIELFPWAILPSASVYLRSLTLQNRGSAHEREQALMGKGE